MLVQETKILALNILNREKESYSLEDTDFRSGTTSYNQKTWFLK